MSKRKLRWLTVEEVIAFQAMTLAEAGGQEGIRDHGLLESALGRPLHHWQYEEPDLFDLAAAYAHAIANNHPFLDGNKRAAFMAAFVFLIDNGIAPPPDPAEAAAMTIALADKSVSESQYAAWLRDRSADREVPGPA